MLRGREIVIKPERKLIFAIYLVRRILIPIPFPLAAT